MVAALLTALLCWACTDDTAESPDTRPVLTIAATEDTWQSQTVTITRSGETLETLKANTSQEWDFTKTPAEDIAAMKADVSNWTYDSSKERYTSKRALENEALIANSNELEIAKGLKFTADVDKIKIDIASKNGKIQLGGKDIVLTIPELKKGQTITISFATSSSENVSRSITASGSISGGPTFTSSDNSTPTNGTVTLTADGTVTFTTEGAINIYSIKVSREVTDGFGIFSTSLGLDNQQVLWENDVWDYGLKLLWPNNEVPAIGNVDIRAYAPYDSSISRTGEDDKIAFNPALRNTIDLLWAERKSINPSGALTLNFKHALGMLSFGHITNSYGRDITLKKIKLSGTRFIKRQLSLKTGTWSGTYSEEISDENDLDLTVADNASESIPMPAILQIPGQAVRIEFTFESADYGTEVITKDITFEQGINKTVNLIINMNHEVVIQ